MANSITVPIFVAHGAQDSFVAPEVMKQFQEEMRTAAAPIELLSYSGAKHSFTNPAADGYAKQFGIDVGYNKAADLASWADGKKFLQNYLVTGQAKPKYQKYER